MRVYNTRNVSVVMYFFDEDYVEQPVTKANLHAALRRLEAGGGRFTKSYVLRDMEDYITKCVKEKGRITDGLKCRSSAHDVGAADLLWMRTCM